MGKRATGGGHGVTLPTASERVMGTGRPRWVPGARACADGYEDVIDLSQESLSEGVMRLTDGKGVEAALDSVGGSITGECLKSLAPGGKVVHIGYPAGTDLNVSSMALIWGNHGTGSTSIHGFNIYLLPGEAFGDAWSVLLPLESGEVKPLLDNRTYPLEQAAEAHPPPHRRPAVLEGCPDHRLSSTLLAARQAGGSWTSKRAPPSALLRARITPP